MGISARPLFFSLMQQKKKKWTHMEGGLMDETGLNVTSGQQVLEVAEVKILFLFSFFLTTHMLRTVSSLFCFTLEPSKKHSEPCVCSLLQKTLDTLASR